MRKEDYELILKHYKFKTTDAVSLKSISQTMMPFTEGFLDGFYEFIFEFDHASKFISTEEILNRHRAEINKWYHSLFSGSYDEEYFQKLSTISEVHVNIGLPAHYVNAAFSYVRRFVREILINNEQIHLIGSFEKLIDINLDILTLIYREEEQNKLLDEIIFIKSSVENDNIVPFVQPIINAKTMKIQKYECLMRLIDTKNNKALSVFPYLATAKKTHLYKPMMKIMIEKSFKLFCQKDIEFSINLGYEDISDVEFKNYIYEKISTCTNPKYVIFEILETDFIEDFDVIKDFAKTVRNYGCKIAIDDFGSGYSNMENIITLKPEILKIDGSLIKSINTSSEAKTIVKNVINMAKELNTKTVAEYIHNKEVLDIVQELGVDYLQGFYLGEPFDFSIK
jgi:EAL domain-containing protein (putative c-di-GMP-specific phosphodiesterase class I)